MPSSLTAHRNEPLQGPPDEKASQRACAPTTGQYVQSQPLTKSCDDVTLTLKSFLIDGDSPRAFLSSVLSFASLSNGLRVLCGWSSGKGFQAGRGAGDRGNKGTKTMPQSIKSEGEQ